ncbi:MAG: hypothetical protein M3Y54_15275 [Bacteroidota bacterium]|nr:hypothetical protein [Bacteroidota bacterium]
MSTTRKFIWLLLATLPGLGLQCPRRYCDVCPMPDCTGSYQGSLSLRPASRAWLPAAAPDSLRFVNSNGFRAVLDRVALPAVPDSVTLPAAPGSLTDYRETTLAPQYQNCQLHFRARRVGWRYQGRNLNLDLRFNLFKDLGPGLPGGATPLTRTVADTLPDLVAVSFNEEYFAGFPVVPVPYRQPRITGQGRAVYLDSIRLAGRTFFGVYQFSRTPYTTAVQPQFFYFRPGQGLVGFIYSNNEQWGLL